MSPLPTTLRPVLVAVAFAATAFAATTADAQTANNGVVRLKSAYPIDESIARVKQAVAERGITFFAEIDQSALAARHGVSIRPSTLLEFGNPALGSQFVAGNPDAGLDWPVRLLLTQDDNGQVWAVWNDFSWIARRHAIVDRDAPFATATRVIGSITSTIAAPR